MRGGTAAWIQGCKCQVDTPLHRAALLCMNTSASSDGSVVVTRLRCGMTVSSFASTRATPRGRQGKDTSLLAWAEEGAGRSRQAEAPATRYRVQT